MVQHEWFLTLSGQVATDINNYYTPALMALLQELEIQGTDVFVVQTAVSELPKPLTPDIYLQRTPYQSKEIILANFEGACDRGYLHKIDDETFRLTDQGESVAREIPTTAVAAATTIQPLPETEVTQLVALLGKVVKASVKAKEMPHPALNRSRFYDPGEDAPATEKIRRYLNDLNAYRDDAHIAAWRTYELEGYEWEAFSHIHADYVFGEPVFDGAGLAQKLSSFRGYDADAYDQALQKVAARGWLKKENGRYIVTEEGKQVREAVEAETDRLFYSTWVLTDAESVELKTLLEKFHAALEPPETKAVWQAVDDARQALAQHFWPPLQKQTEELGLLGWDLMLTRRAVYLDEGVSADYILAQIPYMKREKINEHLAGAAERGFITEVIDGQFEPTENGREAVTLAMNTLDSALADLQSLSAENLEQLVDLLQKLSDAMSDAPEPNDKPTTLDGRLFAADQLSWHGRVNQHLVNIIGFRDDAHVAAWKPYEMPGYQWEAFSHLWGEKVWGDPVKTVSGVAEKLAFRGYSEAEYGAALQDCCQRGLLIETDTDLELTEKGNELRQEAETKTDQIFYAPWATLYVPELVQLQDLLTELSTSLNASND